MGREKRTARSGAKLPAKKAAARNTSDTAPPGRPIESSRDIAELQGAIDELRASFRHYLNESSTWATGNEQSFEGLNERLDEGDDRMDRIERLVREGFAAMDAGFAQLHGAPVNQAAPELEEADGSEEAQVDGERTESDAPSIGAGDTYGDEGHGEHDELDEEKEEDRDEESGEEENLDVEETEEEEVVESEVQQEEADVEEEVDVDENLDVDAGEEEEVDEEVDEEEEEDEADGDGSDHPTNANSGENAQSEQQNATQAPATESDDRPGPTLKGSGLWGNSFVMEAVGPDTDINGPADPEAIARQIRASIASASGESTAGQTAPRNDDQTEERYSMRERKPSQDKPPAKTRKPKPSKKKPTLQSVDEGAEESDEDVPEARDDDQPPRPAFTERLTESSKGKKRKSDAAQVEDDNEYEDHQPQKKKPRKASKKKPESEPESELEEALKQKPKNGKRGRKT